MDEGKSQIKAAEGDEEQRPEEGERKTEIESRITKETHPTKKTKIAPVESNSDSDEAPVVKLKQLEVRVDEDSDAHFPAPPPKRKAAGMASGSTTKGAHSPPRERTRTHMLSPSLPPSNFNSDGTRCVLMPGLLSCTEGHCDPREEQYEDEGEERREEQEGEEKKPVTSAEERRRGE